MGHSGLKSGVGRVVFLLEALGGGSVSFLFQNFRDCLSSLYSGSFFFRLQSQSQPVSRPHFESFWISLDYSSLDDSCGFTGLTWIIKDDLCILRSADQ